jgi:hypothetical protein
MAAYGQSTTMSMSNSNGGGGTTNQEGEDLFEFGKVAMVCVATTRSQTKDVINL